MRRRIKVATVMGTRPEAIKLAPVVRALQQESALVEHHLIATGQHREMLAQVCSAFGLRPEIDLELMQADQGLAEFAARAMAATSRVFARVAPDVVLVQGDTTTAMAAAQAAFYGGIRVGHVEAGLRSFNPRSPFPEEMNRKVISAVADLHFAPTARARDNLLREGVSAETVEVTGNTIVDALQSIQLGAPFDDPQLAAVKFASRRVLLVTAHRRENHGAPLRSICSALRALVSRFDDVSVVFPVHLNPNVRRVVRDHLAGLAAVHLVDPVTYPDLLRLLKQCHIVLTDSGGIQEEAPSFRKPVLILREETERPEVVEVGAGRIVGASEDRILFAAIQLLTDPAEYERMSRCENPFGDGRAAQRIAAILIRCFDGASLGGET